MRGFIGLVKRNILVYIKDYQALFFSILAPIIIFILYILFLRDTFISALDNSIGNLIDYIDKNDITSFSNLILLSSVLGSSLMTISFSSLATIVNDKENKASYDVNVSPISRARIILAYLLASILITFIIVLFIMILSLLICNFINNTYLVFLDYLKLFGILLLGTISACSFMMMIMIFFKTSSQRGAFQGILCAASGFIIGAYIPLSEFNPVIQTICNIFPASHITALFRNTLLGGVVNNIDLALNGIDNHILSITIKDIFGFNCNLFNSTVNNLFSLIYVFVIGIINIISLGIIYNKIYKEN